VGFCSGERLCVFAVVLFGPLAFWQIGDVLFYTGEDYSICPFHHPIGLRVVDRSETQLGA
jgi:hypothetical protein